MQQGKTITLKIILLIFLDNANIWTQVVQIVGIYKKGYRDWKVVLYSEENYYLLEVSEDGNIISIEKKEYSTNNKD